MKKKKENGLASYIGNLAGWFANFPCCVFRVVLEIATLRETVINFAPLTNVLSLNQPPREIR